MSYSLYGPEDNRSEHGETKSSRLGLEEGMGLLQLEGRELAISGLRLKVDVAYSEDFYDFYRKVLSYLGMQGLYLSE